MLPKGAISSVEELEEIDRRAKAGEKIKLYWASAHLPILAHQPTLMVGYASGGGVRGGGRQDYIVSALPFSLACQVDFSIDRILSVSNVLFTNYFHAWAWAQKINKKKEAA